MTNLRVTQVLFERNGRGLDPEQILRAWPTLPAVASAVSGAGIETAVVVPASSNAAFIRNGVAYRFVRATRVSLLSSLLAAVRDTQPSVGHVQGLVFPRETRALCHHLGDVPVLAQHHGGGLPNRLRRLVHRWGLRRLAGAAFTVREQAEPFRIAGVLRRELPVFEVLESSSHFTPGDQGAAQAATGLWGDPCLLWVGRLDANKDPLTVIDAFRRVVPELPDPHLWCAYTEAPLLPQVRQRLSRDRDLGRRVHLLGAVPHERVEQLCRAADFLVSGSHTEGSGYAVLEALACGTTPLVTDIPSFRRLTGQGKAGAVSPRGNSDAMASAIIDWSRRDRSRLREAARAHFERALSFGVVAADLKAAYEALARRS